VRSRRSLRKSGCAALKYFLQMAAAAENCSGAGNKHLEQQKAFSLTNNLT
jgi:hypothetical protein